MRLLSSWNDAQINFKPGVIMLFRASLWIRNIPSTNYFNNTKYVLNFLLVSSQIESKVMFVKKTKKTQKTNIWDFRFKHCNFVLVLYGKTLFGYLVLHERCHSSWYPQRVLCISNVDKYAHILMSYLSDTSHTLSIIVKYKTMQAAHKPPTVCMKSNLLHSNSIYSITLYSVIPAI